MAAEAAVAVYQTAVPGKEVVVPASQEGTPGEDGVVDLDIVASPRKRLYLSISVGLKSTSRKAGQLRDQRAQRRPHLALRSWDRVRYQTNRLREEKVQQLVKGHKVLPVVGTRDVGDKTRHREAISLRDLKTCELSSEMDTRVIDWLLSHLNGMPQLDDQFFFPTSFARLLARVMTDRSNWLNIQKRSSFLEWHWRKGGKGGRQRKLMAFGKIFLPFRGVGGAWCLAYAQPAVDRIIRIYGTEDTKGDNVPIIIERLQEFIEEVEFHELSRKRRWEVERIGGMSSLTRECGDSGGVLCAYVRELVAGQDLSSLTAAGVSVLRIRMIILGLELAPCPSNMETTSAD